MKAVMISIQPKWCELIANGKKTIEVRKTRPKIETPFKAYIYCTQGDRLIYLKNCKLNNRYCINNYAYGSNVGIANGKVIGEFVCDRITQYNCDRDFQEYFVAGYVGAYMPTREMCLTQKDLFEYGQGKTLYAWHISDLVIYDEPREIGEFKKPDCKCPFPYVWQLPCQNCDERDIRLPIPSWCYVEELKENENG